MDYDELKSVEREIENHEIDEREEREDEINMGVDKANEDEINMEVEIAQALQDELEDNNK